MHSQLQQKQIKINRLCRSRNTYTPPIDSNMQVLFMMEKWSKSETGVFYQHLFINYVKNLQNKIGIRSIKQEYSKMKNNNSLFCQLEELTRLKNLQQQCIVNMINEQPISGEEKFALKDICEMLKKYRDNNYKLFSCLFCIHKKYELTLSFQKSTQVEFYKKLFLTLGRLSQQISQSWLNQFIIFGHKFDPFLCGHYEQTHKNPFLQQKYRNQSIIKLFQLSESDYYNYLKASNLIHQTLTVNYSSDLKEKLQKKRILLNDFNPQDIRISTNRQDQLRLPKIRQRQCSPATKVSQIVKNSGYQRRNYSLENELINKRYQSPNTNINIHIFSTPQTNNYQLQSGTKQKQKSFIGKIKSFLNQQNQSTNKIQLKNSKSSQSSNKSNKDSTKPGKTNFSSKHKDKLSPYRIKPQKSQNLDKSKNRYEQTFIFGKIHRLKSIQSSKSIKNFHKKQKKTSLKTQLQSEENSQKQRDEINKIEKRLLCQEQSYSKFHEKRKINKNQEKLKKLILQSNLIHHSLRGEDPKPSIFSQNLSIQKNKISIITPQEQQKQDESQEDILEQMKFQDNEKKVETFQQVKEDDRLMMPKGLEKTKTIWKKNNKSENQKNQKNCLSVQQDKPQKEKNEQSQHEEQEQSIVRKEEQQNEVVMRQSEDNQVEKINKPINNHQQIQIERKESKQTILEQKTQIIQHSGNNVNNDCEDKGMIKEDQSSKSNQNNNRNISQSKSEKHIDERDNQISQNQIKQITNEKIQEKQNSAQNLNNNLMKKEDQRIENHLNNEKLQEKQKKTEQIVNPSQKQIYEKQKSIVSKNSSSIQKNNVKIQLKFGKYNYQQVQQYFEIFKQKSVYKQYFNIKQINKDLQKKQIYLIQFQINNEKSCLCLCSPSFNNSIVIKFFSVIKGYEKYSLPLFKKVVELIEKNTSIERIYYKGLQFSDLTPFNFKKMQTQIYERIRELPLKIKQNQFKSYLSIQNTQINFDQDQKQVIFYSEQIQEFSLTNYYCDSSISKFHIDKLGELDDNYQYFKNLTNMKKVNQILSENSLDTYEGEQLLSIKDINLLTFEFNSAFKKGFIASKGLFKFQANKLYQNQNKVVYCLDLAQKDCKLYIGDTENINQFETICKDKKQNKSVQYISVKMFNKKLYGRYSSEQQSKKSFYANWQVNLFWQDELQGSIKHNMRNCIVFGQTRKSFFIGIQLKSIFIYAFKVDQRDFIFD